MHNPAHPGEVLRELMGDTTVKALAARLKVDRASLSNLLNGCDGASASMALRLEMAFGTSAEMWMNIQSQFDLWQERRLLDDASYFVSGGR